MRGERRQEKLAPVLANLVALEGFVRDCDFLTPQERDKALLVATEYFENIVSYNKCPVTRDITVSVEKGRHLTVVLSYSTCNFGELVRSSKSIRPHYDADIRRYRGLGLLMCKNIAKSIRYRKGLLNSSVLIIL
ncbi:MAG TPA: hypothetical protein PKO22_02875 [Treponemataceae bacterium]|nr:hypothetical protein [Treponemataceae bacterium]